MTALTAGTNSFGTVWNEWQTNWTGRFTNRTTSGRTTTTVSGRTGTATRTGITRTISGSNVITQSFGNRVVDVAFIPFIRSQTISFSATRLKPNTKVFPFFDNESVSSSVTPSGGVAGGTLTTDANGAVSGTFTIPNTSTSRFRVGERVFRLTSSSTNSDDDDSVDTFADGVFTARGLQITTEETVQSTRVPIIRAEAVSQSEARRTVDRITSVTSSPPSGGGGGGGGGNNQPTFRRRRRRNARGSRARRRRDPIAQTFFVNDLEGAFITKVDLFFETKDDNIPVKVYLTETIEGRPGQRIIPFSEVILNPSDVNTSTDASSATTFTFSGPIFLQGGKEYAIVVKPDSQNYKAYVSRLGDNIIGSTRRVSQQPLLGSFFRSQNTTLWTEDQMEDLKFTLHQAQFTVDTEGTLLLTNDTVASKTLDNNPIETDSSSGSGSAFGGNPNIIRITHPGHGMQDSSPSKVTISGLGATTDFNGIQGSVINGTHDIGNVTEDTYTITLTGDPATSTGAVGGTSVVATQDRAFEVIQPQIGQLILPETDLLHAVKTTSTQSVHGSETAYTKDSSFTNIVANDNFYFTSARAILSGINESTHISSAKSFDYQIKLISSNPNLSPVVDLGRSNVICIHNQVDSPTNSNTTGFLAETDPDGGSAAAKYITREVTLENPSTALEVRLAANVFPTSEIEVFRKVRSPDDDTPMDQIPYVEMTQSNTLQNSEERSQSPYNEAYRTNFFDFNYGETNIPEFSSFKIKIVMKGTNPAYPPRVKDMRTIALAI